MPVFTSWLRPPARAPEQLQVELHRPCEKAAAQALNPAFVETQNHSCAQPVLPEGYALRCRVIAVQKWRSVRQLWAIEAQSLSLGKSARVILHCCKVSLREPSSARTLLIARAFPVIPQPAPPPSPCPQYSLSPWRAPHYNHGPAICRARWSWRRGLRRTGPSPARRPRRSHGTARRS